MDIPLSPLVAVPPCGMAYAGQIARDQGQAVGAQLDSAGQPIAAELARRSSAIVYGVTRPAMFKPIGMMNAMVTAMTTPAAIAGVALRPGK